MASKYARESPRGASPRAPLSPLTPSSPTSPPCWSPRAELPMKSAPSTPGAVPKEHVLVDETLACAPDFELLSGTPIFEVDKDESPLILDGQVMARGQGKLNFPRKAIFRLRDATLYGYAKRGPLHSTEAASASLVGATISEKVGGTVKIEFADGTVLKMTAPSPEESKVWVEALRRASCRNIERFYRFGGVLGEGKYGKVSMGYNNASGEPVAIKVMPKNDMTRTQLKNVDREITLATMDMVHPNLVRTFDVFNDNYNVYVVMELMEGGELFDFVEHLGAFSEQQARSVFKQIVKGVRYLHGRGVAHRDLKLENVLVNRFEFPVTVKLADFGLSGIKLQSQGSRPFQGTYGTPMYIAPEVASQRPYGLQADMWSCGVILYVLLSGMFPFPGDSVKEVLSLVRRADYDFEDVEWKGVSTDAKDLISRLLELDPDLRLTPDQALRHAWLHATPEIEEDSGPSSTGTGAIPPDRKQPNPVSTSSRRLTREREKLLV